MVSGGEYDVELKQLEGTERTRDSVLGGVACPVCAAATVFPVNVALEEMELLAACVPEMLQRRIRLFGRAVVVGAQNRKVFMCELLAVGIP